MVSKKKYRGGLRISPERYAEVSLKAKELEFARLVNKVRELEGRIKLLESKFKADDLSK